MDSVFGSVRNPWKYKFRKVGISENDTVADPEDWYIAGGSSGGSAVAVATGVAYA